MSGRLLFMVFLDGEVAQHGALALFAVHEADTGDVGFNDMDLLQRRHNQQLQIEALKQFQAITRRLVGAASKCFIDHHEAKRAGAGLAPLQSKLIGEAGSQHRVGELLFLASGFSAGIRIVFILRIILAPALGG